MINDIDIEEKRRWIEETVEAQKTFSFYVRVFLKSLVLMVLVGIIEFFTVMGIATLYTLLHH